MNADTASVMQLVGDLLARRSWSREQLLEHRRTALRELVRDAVERSPYYREALGHLDDDDVELAELPTLPKATLLDEWDRIVTDPRLRLAEVEEQVAGPAAGELYLGEYRLLTTGGSTGMRGIFVNDRRDFQLTMAGMLRTVVDSGIGPETRVVSIGSPSPLHLSNQVFATIRSGRRGSPPLAVTQPIDEIVNALEAYRPEADRHLPVDPAPAGRGAARRSAHHRPVDRRDGLRGAERRGPSSGARGLGPRGHRRLRLDGGRHDGERMPRARRPPRVGGHGRPRARRRAKPARATRDAEPPGAADEPLEQGPADHSLRARGLDHRSPMGRTPPAGRSPVSSSSTGAATTSSDCRRRRAARSPSTRSTCGRPSRTCPRCASTRSSTPAPGCESASCCDRAPAGRSRAG